jgi:predicted lipoprotein with Yx(FWY)xxD motif
MRTSTIVWVILILVILAGGWYYYSTQMAPATAATGTNSGVAPVPSPTGAAGINGSANQGNLGQPDNGTVQQPGADGAVGSVIGGNVALGLNKSDEYGSYLIAYNGMTLYTYGKDKTATSTCYGKCADNWPPYTVGPEDNVQNVKLGVTGNKVGTITRADGSMQVTYNGLPLYFYVGDKASGDTTGQNVGKVWFVVKP